MKLYIVGLGPGAGIDMTQRAYEALSKCDLITGYTVYVNLLKDEFPFKDTLITPMRKEVDRCRLAIDSALEGKTVGMVCSGDPGVYGMAGLCYELAADHPELEIEVVPGVSAAMGAASVLGAPLMHDFAIISLSDCLTPWDKIAARLRGSALAGFIMCLYNPSSHKRPDYLKRACDILLETMDPATVCGFVRNIGRDGQTSTVTTLGELRDTEVDMFTTVIIGNESTKVINGKMVTPRGYLQREE